MNKIEELQQTIRFNIQVVSICMSFADSSFSYAYVIYLTVPRRSRFGADAATIQLHLDARNRAVRLFHLLLFSLNVEVNEKGERNLRVMSH